MLLEWDDKYSVGNNELDRQHKRLFDIASGVFELASSESNLYYYDELTKALSDLKDYTKYHFEFEEEFMREKGYSNFENHRIEHNFFIKKLERLSRRDINENQNSFIKDITLFLSDWITSHILKSDMGYKELL